MLLEITYKVGFIVRLKLLVRVEMEACSNVTGEADKTFQVGRTIVTEGGKVLFFVLGFFILHPDALLSSILCGASLSH